MNMLKNCLNILKCNKDVILREIKSVQKECTWLNDNLLINCLFYFDIVQSININIYL